MDLAVEKQKQPEPGRVVRPGQVADQLWKGEGEREREQESQNEEEGARARVDIRTCRHTVECQALLQEPALRRVIEAVVAVLVQRRAKTAGLLSHQRLPNETASGSWRRGRKAGSDGERDGFEEVGDGRMCGAELKLKL